MAHMYGMAFEFLVRVYQRLPCILISPHPKPSHHRLGIQPHQASRYHSRASGYREDYPQEGFP